MKQRLQKFIAQSTAYSRRRAEELINQGLVKVNGQTINKQGQTVDSVTDQVEINGRKIKPIDQFSYWALHKPVGYVCTRAKFPGEKSVYQLIPGKENLVIAGRLDKNSSGLLILTDDGELVQQLTHPRFQHQKEYLVKLDKPIGQADLVKLKRGVRLAEGLAQVDIIQKLKSGVIKIVLHQGWKRQIRRMLEEIGYQAIDLQRVRIGKFKLGTLKTGQCKPISKNAII